MRENAQHHDLIPFEAERKAVDALYDAFNKKDLDMLDVALTADWEDIPPGAGQGPGPAGFKPLLRNLFIAFPDLAVVIEDVIHVPGRIAVRARMNGTHAGTLFGIPKTGKHVSFGIHEFHELEGGRIRRTWHVEDWFSLFLQFGAFPPLSGSRP